MAPPPRMGTSQIAYMISDHEKSRNRFMKTSWIEFLFVSAIVGAIIGLMTIAFYGVYDASTNDRTTDATVRELDQISQWVNQDHELAPIVSERLNDDGRISDRDYRIISKHHDNGDGLRAMNHLKATIARQSVVKSESEPEAEPVTTTDSVWTPIKP